MANLYRDPRPGEVDRAIQAYRDGDEDAEPEIAIDMFEHYRKRYGDNLAHALVVGEFLGLDDELPPAGGGEE